MSVVTKGGPVKSQGAEQHGQAEEERESCESPSCVCVVVPPDTRPPEVLSGKSCVCRYLVGE